jgi:glycosyltransferase involved in cell wall biosynthesis
MADKVAKILLKCHDVVGKTMAGPAIRYWEFAKALSKKHSVTLWVPEICRLSSSDFKIIDDEKLIHFKDYDVILTQLIDPKTALKAKFYGNRLIYDAYDPEPLEHLEIFKNGSLTTRHFLNEKIINTVNFSLEMADGYLCANNKQRDLWTGFLLSLKRIDPKLYDKDTDLSKTVGIVPFGIPSKMPFKRMDGFRKQFNLKSTDKLIIWGGGIWNWFDPLTLISAMKILADKRPDIKLVFMGLIHPNAAALPAMSMAVDAKNLATSFDLINKTVFFNDRWIPYEDRENYLLEADAGISTHFEHLETRYSFRTRLLDYIWIELPIIATGGDAFAELIEKEQLGCVVKAGDSQGLASSIDRLMSQPDLLKTIKENFKRIKTQFYWENVTIPINNMIDHLADRPRERLNSKDVKKIFVCCWRKLGPYSLFKRTKIYISQMINS